MLFDDNDSILKGGSFCMMILTYCKMDLAT